MNLLTLEEAREQFHSDEIELSMDGWAFDYSKNIIGYVVNDDNQVKAWIVK